MKFRESYLLLLLVVWLAPTSIVAEGAKQGSPGETTNESTVEMTLWLQDLPAGSVVDWELSPRFSVKDLRDLQGEAFYEISPEDVFRGSHEVLEEGSLVLPLETLTLPGRMTKPPKGYAGTVWFHTIVTVEFPDHTGTEDFRFDNTIGLSRQDDDLFQGCLQVHHRSGTSDRPPGTGVRLAPACNVEEYEKQLTREQASEFVKGKS